ncbi:MAG: sulfatase-like hydrolase/transferase [Tenericutes bacterium]|nr:sulfatase-like hydrolase/transferase [Mycoplasmatota bacterium]
MNMNKIKGFLKNFFDYICKYKEIILLALPFLILDLTTRIFFPTSFVSFWYIVPNLFTILWCFLFLGIVFSFKSKIGRKIYVLILVCAMFIFLLNNVYYSMTDNFFDFSLIEMARESTSYIFDTVLKAKIWIYLVCLAVMIFGIWVLKMIPNKKENDYKNLIVIFVLFLVFHSFIPFLYGKANNELTWNTWKNKRNVYINFNDNNKSMAITGLYEYTCRNIYVTFFKTKKTNNQIELNFLEEVFNNDDAKSSNEYTGIFKNKNVIFLQLEGLDSWLLTEKDTPNLYNLMNSSFNFTNHFSYYNGGGSTFNSEFAVNTGYITPLSYNQNAYTFNKNLFNYSMANMFKDAGYLVNAFHMNSKEFYSRGINYSNWGFDNYYGLKDMVNYNDNSYMLDTELINNDTFYDLMFHSDKRFVDYIITYSPHMPFNQSKGVCKLILDKEKETSLDSEKSEESIQQVELTEEECARLQANETDKMIGLLIQALRDNNLYDNTVLVVFTDHYLYTLDDMTILDKYKKTDNNLINHTPFFIWSSNIKMKEIKEVTSQLSILPTVLNLFGIDYNSNYYIGTDALSNDYKGIVLFSDASWYDGNVYVDGGMVTNNQHISSEDLERKNSYIDYIIKKNDLVLKYDYFKILANNAKNLE